MYFPGVNSPVSDCVLRPSNVIGPSAFISAAIASGFDSRRLYFHGFLPSKRQQRLRDLEGLQGEYFEKRGCISFGDPK